MTGVTYVTYPKEGSMSKKKVDNINCIITNILEGTSTVPFPTSPTCTERQENCRDDCIARRRRRRRREVCVDRLCGPVGLLWLQLRRLTP